MTNESKTMANGALIWITGYPNCGKTTVAHQVTQKMLGIDMRVVHLDGDKLREIFLQKWGYDKAQRTELANIYLRLCRELVSQHFIVILSAVAMFEELYQWVRSNIEQSMIVYLDVPSDERLKRDYDRKKVYSVLNVADMGYLAPSDPDITIENYGDVSSNKAADMIFKQACAQLGIPCHDQ